MTQSIGQKLKQAREEQNLTLDKASEGTHIRLPYLNALEIDDLSLLPSPVQARGFLRNYAEYLGLNIEQLLDELRANQTPTDQIIGPVDEVPPLAPQTLEPGPAPLAQLEYDSDAQDGSSTKSVPEKTIHRGRRKAEPDVESEPQAVDHATVDEDAFSSPAPQLLSNAAEEANINDSLWQTWLNRLGSLLRKGNGNATQADTLVDALPETSLTESEEAIPEVESQEFDPVDESLESTQIFKEIGSILRARRELLSLHFDEVERNTHVKAHYLEALENGAMNRLPSTVQTRGMLSNYATFLDLDVDALLLRYADALQAWHREKNPQMPARKPGQPITANIPPLRSFIAGDMIFGVGVAILLIGFSIWGINQVMILQSQKVVHPTAPPISDILLASPDPSLITPTATLLQIQSVGKPTETIVIPTQNLNVNVQVNLVAVERTFMRVVVDGKEVFNGRVVPGNAYPFEAEDQVEVLVGSGAAIRIVYNGQDLGLLGGLGQVIDNIYRADEIITPTVQPTPTPTKTPPVTATRPATLTPVPSNTTLP